MKYLPSASTHFEDPCRRFVFAPACRGVTSKRSNEFGKTPILSFPAEQSEEISDNPSIDGLNESEEVNNKIIIVPLIVNFLYNFYIMYTNHFLSLQIIFRVKKMDQLISILNQKEK